MIWNSTTDFAKRKNRIENKNPAGKLYIAVRTLDIDSQAVHYLEKGIYAVLEDRPATTLRHVQLYNKPSAAFVGKFGSMKSFRRESELASAGACCASPIYRCSMCFHPSELGDTSPENVKLQNHFSASASESSGFCLFQNGLVSLMGCSRA